jgi:UDP-N-acetylglucosamine acyltransferase
MHGRRGRGEPQDLSYKGADRAADGRSQHHPRASSSPRHQLEQPTTLGDDNFLFGHAHVGHDSQLGNRIIMANGAMLGGHVHVADQVFVSGNCVVHQFVPSAG